MSKKSIEYYGSYESADEVKTQSAVKPEDKDNKEQPYDPKEERVRISGPLSEVYTKALDIVYAKKAEIKDKLSVESQAIDAAIMNSVVGYLNQTKETEMVDANNERKQLKNSFVEPALYLYASDTKNLNSGSLLNKVEELSQTKQENPEVRVAIVVDDMREGISASSEAYETPRSTAAWVQVRKACRKANIELYGSMSAFAKSL